MTISLDTISCYKICCYICSKSGLLLGSLLSLTICGPCYLNKPYPFSHNCSFFYARSPCNLGFRQCYYPNPACQISYRHGFNIHLKWNQGNQSRLIILSYLSPVNLDNPAHLLISLSRYWIQGNSQYSIVPWSI